MILRPASLAAYALAQGTRPPAKLAAATTCAAPEPIMQKMRLIIALPAFCFAVAAFAQIKPEKVIHYRQSIMTLIGWNFSPLGAMANGKIPFDAKEFSKHTERLAFFTPQVLEGFAKGSDKGAETDAKPEIWTDFDDFQAKLNDLIAETKALNEIAKSGDETKMKEQFKKTAGTCKACHDKYKAD